VILTWNVRHFPAKELSKFDLRKQTPDEFLAGLYDEVPELMIGSLANVRRNLTSSRISPLDFIGVSAIKNSSDLPRGRTATSPSFRTKFF